MKFHLVLAIHFWFKFFAWVFILNLGIGRNDRIPKTLKSMPADPCSVKMYDSSVAVEPMQF